MEDLNGTVAVLTGGGSGIGRATAHALARRGSKVIVSDIDTERAKVVAEEIEAGGGQAEGVRCDVSLKEDVATLAEATLREYGRVDIVMSNVGVIAKGDPLDIPFDAWESIVDINLLGTVRVLQSFLPMLIEQGSGHVVTTGQRPVCSRMPTTGSPMWQRRQPCWRSQNRWRSMLDHAGLGSPASAPLAS